MVWLSLWVLMVMRDEHLLPYILSASVNETDRTGRITYYKSLF